MKKMSRVNNREPNDSSRRERESWTSHRASILDLRDSRDSDMANAVSARSRRTHFEDQR